MNMRKKSILPILIIISILLSLTFVQASIKSSKNNYNTGEIVFATSTSPELCLSKDPSETVLLYIVNHRDSWSDGDNFNEVRDDPSEVPNSKFSNEKIWESPETGTYDLIIDCDEDQVYDETSEPIYDEGFIVSSKEGIGKISLSELNPSNFSWLYDSEEPELANEILVLKLLAEDEEINLENITVEVESPGKISLEIYVDKNNDGKLNPSDTSIGNLDSFEGVEIINLDYDLDQGTEESILLVINMNEGMIVGEYSLKVISLSGTGLSSDKKINFFGVPIESNIMTVMDKKTCLGEIELVLEPNPASSSRLVLAKINNLEGCEGKTVFLKANACHLATGEVSSCVFKDNKCEMNIKPIKGNYFACIDKNNDNDKNDFGESNTKELTIVSSEIPQENEEDTTSPITGEVVEDLEETDQPEIQQILKSDPIFVLLEITLLLILFVLVLILFRLGKNLPQETKDTPEEIIDVQEEPEKLKEKKDEKKSIKEETKEKK